MLEIDEMNKSIGSLQDKISRLVHENTSMQDQMRNAQENLRLSANQQQKMARQINEYKQRIEQNNVENENLKQKMNKLQSENIGLNQEVQEAQQNLRLSANTQTKLKRELNEFKTQMEANNRQSETYRQKIQKLMSENTSLSD